MIEKYGKDKPFMRGFVSALDEPLFASKRVDFFDAIIQGHVHWKIYESSPSTDFYSIRAVGMAYAKDQIDTASYVILSEKTNGYDLEEVLVKYDREKMKYSILNSDMPDQTIQRFVNLSSSENLNASRFDESTICIIKKAITFISLKNVVLIKLHFFNVLTF